MKIGSKAFEISQLNAMFNTKAITDWDYSTRIRNILAAQYQPYENGLDPSEETALLSQLCTQNIISNADLNMQTQMLQSFGTPANMGATYANPATGPAATNINTSYAAPFNGPEQPNMNTPYVAPANGPIATNMNMPYAVPAKKSIVTQWWFWLIIVVVVLIIIGVARSVGESGTASSRTTGTSSTNTPTESDAPAEEKPKVETPVVDTSKPAFNRPFEFDNLEITVGDVGGWSKVENQFAEENGMDAFWIPLHIKNIDDENNMLNMFYVKAFGSKGTQLSDINFYFDDTFYYAGELRPGAEYDSKVYFLYDGDGEYVLSFNIYDAPVELVFNVKK